MNSEDSWKSRRLRMEDLTRTHKFDEETYEHIFKLILGLVKCQRKKNLEAAQQDTGKMTWKSIWRDNYKICRKRTKYFKDKFLGLRV